VIVMDVLSNSVLVLNASYEAINVCSAKRALVLVCKGAAIVQEKSVHVLRTPTFNLPLPAVIRLLKYRAVPRRLHTVSRKGIMVRDGFTCQYCRTFLSAAKLTLDHVTPRSRGGKSTWENLVACCYQCNNRKGDKTPAEARMQLARPPKQFGVHARHKLLSQGSELWGKYLFC
jgi:5-methylcytosine-specific restriction endonuclease McrA